MRHRVNLRQPQIDAEFEAVSASLKVPFWRTFGRVTVPICMPAILDIAVYMFVNALTTVSSVIFLYGAGTKLASIAIVHMDESGTIAAATAAARFDDVKSSYVYCTGGDTLSWYLSQSPGRSADGVLKAKLDGPYRLIESGHWPMITKPKELAEAMPALAGGP